MIPFIHHFAQLAGKFSTRAGALIAPLGPKGRGSKLEPGEQKVEKSSSPSVVQSTSSNSAQDDIVLAGFAHELKTPLSIIRGYVEILLEGKFGPLTEDQRLILNEVTVNGNRLKKFVDEFLAHAALGAHKVRTRFETGRLNECLNEICALSKNQVQLKKLALYFHPDSTLEPFVFDQEKIEHVVWNLIDNAVKFTPAGGSIWVTTKRSLLEPDLGGAVATGWSAPDGLFESRPAVKVVVADTGPGIPAEYRTEVFAEFFKISNQQGNPHGTGLGLSIAKRLVQMHGGRIWIEGEPGAGTRVCFLLPMWAEGELTEVSSL